MTDEINVNRKAGKFGALKATLYDALWLHDFLAPSEEIETAWDITNGVTNEIGMLGNDEEGDCVEAAFEHLRYFKALRAFISKVATFEPGFRPAHTAYTLALYWAFQIAYGAPGPHPDNGTDPGSFAVWTAKKKLTEAVAQVAWQPINGNGFQNLKDAAVKFNGVLLCIACPPQMQAQFEAGEVLTVGPDNQPDPDEGHGIALLAFDDATQLVKVATWGTVVEATYEFVQTCLTAAFVFVTEEDAHRTGFNLTAAIEALEQLPAPIVDVTVPTLEDFDGISDEDIAQVPGQVAGIASDLTDGIKKFEEDALKDAKHVETEIVDGITRVKNDAVHDADAVFPSCEHIERELRRIVELAASKASVSLLTKEIEDLVTPYLVLGL